MLDSTPNPLKALRLSAGVSAVELAALAGVSRAAVNSAESGGYASLPPSWRSAVEALGGDYTEVAAAYVAWKLDRAEAVTQRLGK